MESRAGVVKDFESDLEDLTFNSKPIINTLTMTAGKHSQFAPEIVEVVKNRFFKVKQDCKLPTLYLMDSMIKNLGGEYLQELTRGVVGVFCHAFESLNDPKIRISLYKLRQTWNPYIPVRKLAAIDNHIHAIDPNWPVTAREPSSPTIFLNPKFLESKEEGTTSTSNSNSSVSQSSAESINKALTPPPPKKSPINSASLTPPPNKKKGKSPHPNEVTKSNSTSTTQQKSQQNDSNNTTAPVSRSKSPLIKKKIQSLKNTSKLSPEKGVATPPLSVQEKRKKVLEEQRQLKKNKQVLMGILPPPQDEKSLSNVLQKHKRSSSPSPQKKKKIKSIVKRPRSASPSVATETGLKKWTIPRISKEGVAGKKHIIEETEQVSSAAKVSRKEKEEEKGGDEGIKEITEGTLDLTDLPPELFKKHQNYIMEQAQKRLESGTLTKEQHDQLVKQVDQLYELQRLSNKEKQMSSNSDIDTEPQSPASHTHDSVSHTHDSVSHTHDSVSHPHDSVSHTLDSVSHTHDSVSHPHDSVSHTLDSVSHPHDSVSHDSTHRTLLPFPSFHHKAPHHARGHRPHRDNFRSRGGMRGGRPFRGRNRPPYRNRPFRGQSPPPHIRGQSPPPHIRGQSPPPHIRGQSPPPHIRGQSPPPHISSQSLPPHIRGQSPPQIRGQSPPPHIGGGQTIPPLSNTNMGPVGDAPPPTSVIPNVMEITSLYEKLKNTGLLPSLNNDTLHHQPHPQPSTVVMVQPTVSRPKLPIIRLDIKDLKVFRKDLHIVLHEGEPCTSCGLRFTETQRDDYQKHLDWHFQENRMDKEGFKATMRNWYLHPDDWLTFDISVRSLNQNEPLLMMETDNREDSVGGKDEEKGNGTSCQVLPGEDTQVCGVCHEQLEQFWEEEEEEWHFKDAIRTPDGHLYHSYCYIDSKESQGLPSLTTTPISQDNKPLSVSTI